MSGEHQEHSDELEALVREELGWSVERTVHFVALGRLMIRVRHTYCRQSAPETLRERIASVCAKHQKETR